VVRIEKNGQGSQEMQRVLSIQTGNKTDGSESSYVVPLRLCKDNWKAK